MHIVAAGVHDWLLWLLALGAGVSGVGHAHFRRVGQVCAFEDREGVHVCSQQDCGTGAVVEGGGEAVAADRGCDFEGGVDGLEVGGHCCGGFGFIVRELWVGVEVSVERDVSLEVWPVG